jgi:hypothetical protein
LAAGAFGKAAAERPDVSDPDDARDQPYVTPLTGTYERVRDAGGSMGADARTDHFADGRVRPVEPEWLTVEQMRVIAGVKALNSRYF